MLSGFETDTAILLLIAGILFSFAIAWWTYSSDTRLPTPARWLNISLRGLAFLILIMLLFNPSINLEDSRDLKQRIAVLIDNSRSVTIEKGEWQGLESMNDVVQALNLSDTTAVRYSIFGFDRDLFASPIDSLDFDGSVTDINSTLRSLNRESTDLDAVIMVTDGIFNRGLDPTSTAIRMGVPFYNIAIGDTTRLRDVLVRNVFYNSDAFTNTIIPIQAEILIDGFPNRTVDVRLIADGELVETKQIRSDESRSVHNLDFELMFETEGTKSVRIEIPELGEEWTTLNNTYSFSLNIRDERIRILHLAFEVHPDVGALRNLLATDESIVLNQISWAGRDRFVNGPLPTDADTLDVIILHGYPPSGLSSSIRQQVASLVSGQNVVALSLPLTNQQQLSSDLANTPPLRVTGPVQTAPVLPSLNDAERDNAILDLEIPNFTRAPDLTGSLRNMRGSGNARVLLYNSFRGEATDVPAVAISEIGNTRFAQVSSWNWFRWQQSTQPEIRSFYRGFFNNLVKWTSADSDDPILNVETTRNQYEEGDAVVFRGNVRTEAGQPDTQARVEIEITGPDMESMFTMQHQGSGRFGLDIGTLPAGTYTYNATSFRGGTQTGEQQGSFTVNESILEFMDTIRRDQLLRFIAEESGGAFFSFEQTFDLRTRLQNDGLLGFRTETFVTVKRIHHQIWWFIAVLLLLTTEWIVRKKYDMV